MKRIVFLDFDGVLNSERFHAQHPISGSTALRESLDPEAIARLNAFLAETGASVVVSSSWRKLFSLETLQELLGRKGFSSQLIGVTPNHAGRSIMQAGQRNQRGFEIEAWLAEHAPEAEFVIFDDDTDTGNLHHRFVQTDAEDGLLDEHIALARKLFGLSSNAYNP